MKKINAWKIRHLVDESFVPASKCIILKIVRFLKACKFHVCSSGWGFPQYIYRSNTFFSSGYNNYFQAVQKRVLVKKTISRSIGLMYACPFLSIFSLDKWKMKLHFSILSQCFCPIAFCHISFFLTMAVLTLLKPSMLDFKL